MKKVTIEIKEAEFYVNAINKKIEENTKSNIRLRVASGRSIEIYMKSDEFVKNALLTMTKDFYEAIEGEFKKLGVPGYVKYNNTKDTINYWIDSNTRAWY